MSSINTRFQQQAADIIVDLINRGEIVVKQTLIDCFDDRKFFRFQFFSYSMAREICLVQQIEYANGKKEGCIYFDGRRKKWNQGVITYLLAVAFEKAPEPTPLIKPNITVVV